VRDFLKAAVRPEVLGPDVGLLVRGSDLEELRGARMEQIAAPDSAYLTEHTAKLVEGLIQLQDLGKLAVKGVKEPLGVYALQGIGRLHTKIEVSRARGFSKFVENVHQDVQVGRAEREIMSSVVTRAGSPRPARSSGEPHGVVEIAEVHADQVALLPAAHRDRDRELAGVGLLPGDLETVFDSPQAHSAPALVHDRGDAVQRLEQSLLLHPQLVLRVLGYDLFPGRELFRLQTHRDVEDADVEHALVLEEIHTHLPAPRRSADVLDELDRLPRHQEIALVSALDLERVKPVAVGGDRDVLAELEEDGVHRLPALLDRVATYNMLVFTFS
jgi:hypothetical protein